MKLFRSIALNEGEEINTDNLGNSWTLDEFFAEKHAEDYNGFAKKDGYVILSIDVDFKDIDLDNSLFSMENRDYEFEVVVNNLDVEFKIEQVQGLDSFELGDVFSANTGENDFEDYCNEYNGDLTKEDLIELINEFE